jgi:hypothetical protein
LSGRTPTLRLIPQGDPALPAATQLTDFAGVFMKALYVAAALTLASVSLVRCATMVARGWVAEGDGPDLIVMCAPA